MRCQEEKIMKNGVTAVCETHLWQVWGNDVIEMHGKKGRKAETLRMNIN